MFLKNGIKLTLGMAVAGVMLYGCGSDPQTSNTPAPASVSGTVVFAGTEAPAAGTQVTFDHCTCGDMDHMSHMTGDWEDMQHAMTDDAGHFHFEYMHQGMHSYRVSVPGSMHYLDGGAETGIVLEYSPPSP